MMSIPLSYLMALSAILFSIGVAGVLLRRNALVVFMCIELMLNAVNLGFVSFSRSLHSLDGVMFVFFILVVAAAEAVVGLAIMLALFRQHHTLQTDTFNLLKW